jgi:hypothetical protein
LSALFDDVLDLECRLKPLAVELAFAGISKFDCLPGVMQGNQFDNKKVESCLALCGDTARTLWDVASPRKPKAINDLHKLVITTWPITLYELVPERLRPLFSRPSFMGHFKTYIKEASEAKRDAAIILQSTSTGAKQRTIPAKSVSITDRQVRQTAVSKFKLRHKVTTQQAAELLGTTYDSLQNFCKGRGRDSAASAALIWKGLKASNKS